MMTDREKRLQDIRERADYYAQEDLDVWGIDHARYVVDVRWLLDEIERLNQRIENLRPAARREALRKMTQESYAAGMYEPEPSS